MRYHNYHKHDHFGNPWIPDSVAKPVDYCKRAVELGHDAVFTVDHGITGNIFDWIGCSKEYGLKMCYGTEAYFVKNRFEKDRSNRHIVIIAKNNDGVMQLNDIMSEAHSTGFYYRPRIDQELLFSLEPKNFIVTSACVAGIWNDSELLLALHRKFNDNFFLELQDHNMDAQVGVNRAMLNLAKDAKIPIIHANDSHYIYPEDVEYRKIYLKAKMGDKNKTIEYSEDGMILDYPDSDEIFRRYEEQGVLTHDQVREALDNTLVFDECEPITLINDDIKLPSVSDTPDEDLRKILREKWKEDRKSIPREKWSTYTDAIRYELNIVEKTKMSNYFLIDYNVAKIAQEKYGGKLTNTGRGSAPSFYITKLLGLTDIDRVSAPITLFPTRFMSIERILQSRSLPDIDMNTSDREPFIKATEDLLGKENCAWMLSWKPLQDASAFRVYCKGIGMDISEYDEVAKGLESYENDKKWGPLIRESKRFVGVVESVSESPCSMCLYDKPLRKELGLVRTSKGTICCLLDGYNCDKYKYLKNDYLTVTVWAIIRDVCDLAGIPIPTIREMDGLLDDKTFDIYKKGLTSTINQADSAFATDLAKTYCPKSVSEMSAFVAIIRPGCASLLQDFVHRKPYTTGVPELDNLLVDGSHRMIYQELIMKYLIWLGIPEKGSYDIIKKIAKKKFKEPELEDLKAKLLRGWKRRVGREEGFLETWTVVEQAARYSFNASHSLSYAYDSLYGAYLKSHYPLEYYTVALNYYNGDDERTTRLTSELPYFGISLRPIKFRYSSAKYNLSRETNEIYKGISSIKYMNEAVADELYAFRDKQYHGFVSLLRDISENTSLNARQLDILIRLDFFSEFGDINKLLRTAQLYDALGGKVQVKKEKLGSMDIPLDDMRPYAGKETEKTFTQVNSIAFLTHLSENLHMRQRKLCEKVKDQVECLGYVDLVGEQYAGFGAVLDVDTKYSPKLNVFSLKNGTTLECKVDKKTFRKNSIKPGDMIRISGTKYKPKNRRTEDGEWEPIPGTRELWLTKYQKVTTI